MKYLFSQSGLKDLEDPINCPFRWYASHVDHTEEYQLGEAANWGKYFEYLCLGTDTGVTEWPKLKGGKASAKESRVIHQANIFKNMYTEGSETYNGEQVVFRDVLIKTKKRKGILDYATINGSGDVRWYDLKLVDDLYNGYYKYGNHEKANYDQQVFYDHLIREKAGIDNPLMSLLVFESGTKKRIKQINLNISDSARQLMDERVSKAIEVFDLYEEKGWIKYPSIEECKKCSIKCQERLEDSELPEDTLEQHEVHEDQALPIEQVEIEL